MGCIIRTHEGLRWEPDECQTKIEGWGAEECQCYNHVRSVAELPNCIEGLRVDIEFNAPILIVVIQR